MNGQISEDAKRRPWRNWHVPSRTRIRGATKVSKGEVTALDFSVMVPRVKYGRY